MHCTRHSQQKQRRLQRQLILIRKKRGQRNKKTIRQFTKRLTQMRLTIQTSWRQHRIQKLRQPSRKCSKKGQHRIQKLRQTSRKCSKKRTKKRRSARRRRGTIRMRKWKSEYVRERRKVRV